MASTHDDSFAQPKFYISVAIGAVLLAWILDSCSPTGEADKAAAASGQAATTQTAAKTGSSEPAAGTPEENLKPVENIVAVDKNAPPPPTRSGEEVYQSACMACHAAGVLNAPKLEAGAWDGRVDKGMDGLVHSAINGLNAMPPRGGNPNITDDEIRNAIGYMLAQSGYDLGAGATQTAQADTAAEPASSATETAAVAAAAATATAVAASADQAAAPSAEAPATTETAAAENTQQATAGNISSHGQQIYAANCFTCHDVGIANSPMLGDKAVWTKLAEAGSDALYQSAINGKGVMPAKGGMSSFSDDDVRAAVDYMLDAAEVRMGNAAAAPAQAAATTEAASAETTEAAAAKTAEAAPAAQGGIDGEKIYRSLCFSCHDGGIAGAPKLGDKEAWGPRIAAGMDSLYQNSINGKGVMPAKGGNPALSDDEVKAAVDWMVGQSQ
ncbi:MAG: c-type cytochrome [Thiolinea sp.]